MKRDVDRELAAAFAALRQEEGAQGPPFAEMVRRGRARTGSGASPLRLRLVAAAAAAVVLAGLAARFVRRPPDPSLSAAETRSLVEWRSPTAFLLETPGHEILAAPAGWGRSVLDLDLPSPERKWPS